MTHKYWWARFKNHHHIQYDSYNEFLNNNRELWSPFRRTELHFSFCLGWKDNGKMIKLWSKSIELSLTLLMIFTFCLLRKMNKLFSVQKFDDFKKPKKLIIICRWFIIMNHKLCIICLRKPNRWPKAYIGRLLNDC